MTEDEAKTKWCPMAMPQAAASRIVVADFRDITFGADGEVEKVSQSCIGSKCMMWRSDEGWLVPDETGMTMVRERPGDGYCGLAGKP